MNKPCKITSQTLQIIESQPHLIIRMKLLAFLAICVFASHSQDVDKDLMKISVFFEGDCPDCHEYLRQQLLPLWQGLHRVTLDLVPFGNAEQWMEEGRWRFKCQHGPEECLHNKLYACAIRQACGEGGTSVCERTRLDQVIRYILCVAQQPDQVEGTAQCTSDLTDVTSDFILTCARSEQGSLLLSGYGNRTAAFTPAIDYVPYVAINGEHDTAAENDLIARINELKSNQSNGTETMAAR